MNSFTSTATALPVTDELAPLADWEIRLLLCAREAKNKSQMSKRPSTLLARFDGGVLFLDECAPRGRVAME